MAMFRKRSPIESRTAADRRFARLTWAVSLAGLILVPRAGAQPPAASGPAKVSAGAGAPAPAEFSGSGLLEKVWPGHPEWLAMLADIIVKGDRLEGSDGWFRNDRPQTRLDWQSTRAALDKDGDGSIRRSEFPGTDADFARLDRDHDTVLTAPDFDFSSRPSGPPTGTLLFIQADRDGNGKVTRAEFEAFFTAADSDGLGFLSCSDLQQVIDAPPQMLKGSPGGPDGPTRGTFLKSFFRGEFGGMVPGPTLNETAPDFTLKTVDGKSEVTLSKVVGPKPVVLVFGNYTCRPFRGQGGTLEKLYDRYKDRANFLSVYGRETHPTDGWRMEVNDVLGVSIRQPTQYAERVGVAQLCNKTLGFSFPMLVDKMDDQVSKRYCGSPSRLYLIDSQGKIAYKSGRGPFGFKPAELEHSLVMLLQQDTRQDPTILNHKTKD